MLGVGKTMVKAGNMRSNEWTPRALQAVAVMAARRAAEHAASNAHRRTEVHTRFRNDVKLQLDLECQEIAQETILAACPGHAILGEEEVSASSAADDSSDWRWVIDPIDGTVNFSHGLPLWCCSVAVQYRGRTQAGAVVAPEMGWIVEASVETPARCNGEAIRVSSQAELGGALVQTGADKSESPQAVPFRFFNRIANVVQRPRISGSAAIDISLVAMGKAEGYFEPSIFTWDIAAAGLILERAGGRTSVMKNFGEHRMAFLATNGHIHAALERLLKEMVRETGG